MAISAPERKRAVAYYRHSAEDKQENSVPIQRGHAEKFAEIYAINIIHEEADEGKSGLSADRPGFERLFKDWITNAEAPHFEYVLVYDVSRWGRFQDQNEGAHYEFLCKKHGKKVIYVSRGMPKEEGQLMSHLQTSIERYMAAEYSRQLSEKVFYGCVEVSKQGFSAGGLPAYGMSRLLLDVNKKPIKKLGKGEWKSISNERVTFAPAGDETTEVVKEMFSLLIDKWKSPEEIAALMNERGITTAHGKKWKSHGVVRILTNEVYTGTRVYNKTWSRLKQKMHRNPRSQWVIQPNAFERTVSEDIFSNAQEHLYWLIPSKWRRGSYAVNKAAKNLQKEIVDLFIERGIGQDDAIMEMERLPVVLGVCFYLNNVAHWCFVIDEMMRNYDYIIGVSLSLDRKDPIDRFFVVPMRDIDIANFIVFSETEECYGRYKIDSNTVKEKIMGLIKPRKLEGMTEKIITAGA